MSYGSREKRYIQTPHFKPVFKYDARLILTKLANDISYGLYAIGDINPNQYNAGLSHTPCDVKGQKNYIWSVREMTELLKMLYKKLITLQNYCTKQGIDVCLRLEN